MQVVLTHNIITTALVRPNEPNQPYLNLTRVLTLMDNLTQLNPILDAEGLT
jgi:hypothetical protein